MASNLDDSYVGKPTGVMESVFSSGIRVFFSFMMVYYYCYYYHYYWRRALFARLAEVGTRGQRCRAACDPRKRRISHSLCG